MSRPSTEILESEIEPESYEVAGFINLIKLLYLIILLSTIIK